MINFAMFGSVLLTPLLFLLMPVRRALVTSYCVLWMFLPVASISMPGIPTLDKPAAISVGVLIAMVLFYLDLIIKKFRPQWYDLPVVAFGFVIPFFSALNNDMGMDGALYESVQALFLWVMPYFAGRIILGDEMGVKTLATGIFYAALIYTPFAWFEMLFSPQLHLKIYGYHQHQFQQTVRGWSYRPMVFMTHGLMTSMWLCAGAVCGIWLYRARQLHWKLPVKAKYAVFFLFFTASVSNSMGATLLMLLGLGLLFLMRKVKPAWVLVPLILIPPLYIVTRATGTVSSDELVSLVVPVSTDRALSLQHRLVAEDAYVAKALEQPFMGWGGYGRHRPKDPETGKTYTSDGLWIIVFGKTGLLGLVSMVITLLVVPAIIVVKQNSRVWRHPRFAPAAALTVLLCLYTIDNLLNAMVNPIYILAAGALVGFAGQPLGAKFNQRRPKRRPTPADPEKERRERPVGIVT